MSEDDEWEVKKQPGSYTAQREGCTCPVMDNGHGKGRFGDGKLFGWVVVETCPLHAIRCSS